MTRTSFLTRPKMRSVTLLLLTSIFWILFANASFFKALTDIYPLTADNLPFLGVVVIGFTGTFTLVLCLFCHRYTLKPLLILLLIASSFAAYFMDSYNILIDDDMINNAMSTDMRETADLLSPTMAIYVLLLGLLPSIFVYRTEIQWKSAKGELLSRLKMIIGILVVVLALLFTFSANTSSFFREHKSIRYYSNPASYLFNLGRYVRNQLRSNVEPETSVIGQDAQIPESDTHRELIVMVVGETARADHFSLNGYHKDTNPLLEKQQALVSFSHVTSCATSTALSVPCMFSNLTESNFNSKDAKYTENILDVLQRAGANVLWRDNNSSSKNVADRVAFEDYRSPDVNTICDEECRDEGMLVGLQEYIDSHPKGDIMIVLHQMGNHGPAYYKRYPKEFERFTPTCNTNELSDCSNEEINNAYDNAILYTDYFLNEVIELLKKNDEKFETGLLYVSDHGESLGENGIYLHGMPNFIAPEAQRHVSMIIWVGSSFDEISHEDLLAKKDQPLSHDNIFHTLLGLMEVETTTYDESMDLIRN